jgi:hypothetical protein
MYKTWLGVQRVLQLGLRSHSTIAYRGQTLFGPYYRWEREGADNTAAILASRQLNIGKGIGGRTDGVYSFTRPKPEELGELRKSGQVIEYFAPQPAHEPNALHGGSRAVVWSEEALGYGPLGIRVAAVYAENGQTVYDDVLHAKAKEELGKLGIEIEE